MSSTSIANENLAGKVVLEVGSGRGDTTRSLVDLLSGQPGAQLIVTDASDKFFQQLRDEFQAKDAQIQFMCTGAQELRDIRDHSVDYLVCNYTLCAVNTQAGLVALALRRFWEVLKVGGKLLVEDWISFRSDWTPCCQSYRVQAYAPVSLNWL